MDDLAQAFEKLREAHTLGRSIADYTTAEQIFGGTETQQVLLEVVRTLAKICDLQNKAAALIVRHLESSE